MESITLAQLLTAVNGKLLGNDTDLETPILRVDTDSRGGVPTRLDGLCLNQDTAYLRRILPNAGQWVLLLTVPAAVAALAGLAAKALGHPSEENT